MILRKSNILAFSIFSISCLASLQGESQELIVVDTEGKNISIEINNSETWREIVGKVKAVSGGEGHLIVDIKGAVSNDDYKVKGRNYSLKVTADEKDDIRYILKNLATKTWTEIISSRGSINRAGDRIDPIHPLRFLAAIFSDEELKGCLHSIRDRKQIWKSFFTGLEESLEEESQKNNMTSEFVNDFAKNLSINASAISQLIIDRDWPDLVDTLLKLLPRQGDPGRYDM